MDLLTTAAEGFNGGAGYPASASFLNGFQQQLPANGSNTSNLSSSTSSSNGGNTPALQNLVGEGSAQQPPVSIILTVRLLMQGKEVGSIIGKRGDHVKLVRDMSGAKVNISDGSCPERIVTITGNTTTVNKAFAMIAKKFEEVGDGRANLLYITAFTRIFNLCQTVCRSHPSPCD